MAEVRVRRVVVDVWWRRRPGRPVESIRLVWVPDAERWQVERTGCEPSEFPNRSQALAAVAKLVGEAWVHEPSPRRRGAR